MVFIFLFSRVFQDKKTMMERAVELASEIASKSPVAVATTKLQLNYARDHTVDEGLDYIVSDVMANQFVRFLGKQVLSKVVEEFRYRYL